MRYTDIRFAAATRAAGFVSRFTTAATRAADRVSPFATALLVAIVALIAAPPIASASTLATERVATDLLRPLFVTAPDGDPRLFIVEQRGVIKILADGQVLATPFLDIDALVVNTSGNDERGLLGLAFDPGYAENGRFYVNYVDLSNQTIIARYQVSGDPDLADAGSAEVLLTIAQPYNNHNGGTLAFSPIDGYLYIGMGDGGSGGDPQNRAQNPLTLLGKMLRIDVGGLSGYAVPPDNPFVGNPAYLPEIWALGVRNPFRWSFDAATGDLWIADVGQNNWEEIDFQPAASTGGENYGWRLMEGTHCYDPPGGCDDGDPALVYPIHEYDHDAGCSVTGGTVYRGAALPELAGHYFFADFCSARIWTLRYDGVAVSELTDRTEELAPGGGLAIGSIAAIAADGLGELCIVDRGSGVNGEIYRILRNPASVDEAGADGGGVSGRGAEGPGDGDANGSANIGALSPALRIADLRPNPFSGAVQATIHAERPGMLQMKIFDAAGRERAGFPAVRAERGATPFHWDGRDAGGRLLPSGVYYLSATIEGEAAGRSVQLIR